MHPIILRMKKTGVPSKPILDNRDSINVTIPSPTTSHVPCYNIYCGPNHVTALAAYIMKHQSLYPFRNIGSMLYWNDIGYILPNRVIPWFDNTY